MKTVHWLLMGLVLFASATVASQTEFPTCEAATKLQTEIHLYIDASVLDQYSEEYVEAKLTAWESYANLVLSNSCIPIERKITKVTYNSAIDSYWFQDLEAARELLQYHLADPIAEQSAQGFPVFTGIVFESWLDSYHSKYCGFASHHSYFFAIAINCRDATFEHELGHLSGASHDKHTLLTIDGVDSISAYLTGHYPMKKAYSFGARCAERGTVMSYAADTIPAYSSPSLIVDGQVCGDSETADNARVLKEFATRYSHIDE
ncbi:hypothetical protein [Vibrio sp. qd031]|uniref:hypothetical protein n=1 Tax=Vibrio sp. qd031 TaxID=1603038 RepID=UPI000A108830|nr:hypothetical protein [Vibrio sp. qd031]